jgi:hypothetical protein
VPITLRLDEQRLIEGVADLAFFDGAPEPAWTVVDFKTDGEIERRLPIYRRQVGLYAEAIARATGLPAAGVLLSV